MEMYITRDLSRQQVNGGEAVGSLHRRQGDSRDLALRFYEDGGHKRRVKKKSYRYRSSRGLHIMTSSPERG